MPKSSVKSGTPSDKKKKIFRQISVETELFSTCLYVTLELTNKYYLFGNDIFKYNRSNSLI